MAEQQHPISPPRELMRQWREQAPRYRDGGAGREEWLMERSAQWGADQGLEACCDWLRHEDVFGEELALKLRAARRPKPPSLADEALDALGSPLQPGDFLTLKPNGYAAVIAALKRLKELEETQ